MQRRPRPLAIIGLTLLVLGFPVPSRGSEACKLLYRITTGDSIAESAELFSPSPSGYAVLVDTWGASATQTQSFELDPVFGSRSWQRRNDTEGTNFTAVRCGNVIKVTGIFKHKSADREHKIDSRPWKQCFPVDLQDWAASSEKTITFWAMNPVNLAVDTFTATKKGRETVVVGGKSVEALRVRIAPTGLLARFWHCDVWFRVSDWRYVRFEGASGPPGAPLMTTELIEERLVQG